MCKYLSAIATKESLYVHDMLDSHEHIIDFFELRDDSKIIVRVEFCPYDPKDLGDIEKYKLNVDQPSTPEWWGERKEHVESELRERAKRNIVTTKRKLLTGGAWVLKGAIVDRLIGARIVAMLESSNVGVMLESSNVGEMWGSSKVGEMWESSNVGVMLGSSKVGEMRESSKVEKDNREKKVHP